MVKPTYTIAMSDEDGCIVMLESSRAGVQGIGSMTRIQSLEFARGVLEWIDKKPDPRAITKAVRREIRKGDVVQLRPAVEKLDQARPPADSIIDV